MSFGLVVLLALACVGLTNLVVHGKVFEGLRAWVRGRSPMLGYLVGCYQCSGFWCGLLVGLLGASGWSSVLLWGFAGSFLASSWSLVSDFLVTKIGLPE